MNSYYSDRFIYLFFSFFVFVFVFAWTEAAKSFLLILLRSFNYLIIWNIRGDYTWVNKGMSILLFIFCYGDGEDWDDVGLPFNFKIGGRLRLVMLVCAKYCYFLLTI